MIYTDMGTSCKEFYVPTGVMGKTVCFIASTHIFVILINIVFLNNNQIAVRCQIFAHQQLVRKCSSN